MWLDYGRELDQIPWMWDSRRLVGEILKQVKKKRRFNAITPLLLP